MGASLVVAAVAVVLGLADIPTAAPQVASAGYPGKRFDLGAPKNCPAFLSPNLSRAGPVRLPSDSFMLWHSLEERL